VSFFATSKIIYPDPSYGIKVCWIRDPGIKCFFLHCELYLKDGGADEETRRSERGHGSVQDGDFIAV
jgi:hypothetical protein